MKKLDAPRRGRPNVKGVTRRLSCRLSERANAALETIQRRNGLKPTAAVELALLRLAEVPLTHE